MTLEQSRAWTEATARQSGGILLGYFGGKLTRNIKTHQDDFATEADLAAEQFVIAAIRKNFPEDAILAEESGFHGSHDAEYTWIIDPLDGTWNFANNIPEYGTMIARAHGEDLELAVIFNPSTQQMISAAHGKGVLMNGKGIQIQMPDMLNMCTPVIGYIEQMPGGERVAHVRDYLLSLGCTSPNWHSVAGDVAHILSGDGNVYIGNGFKPWDRAPLDLILREAGLRVTDFSGQPLSWEKEGQDFVAAPERLHKAIMLYCNQ